MGNSTDHFLALHNFLAEFRLRPSTMRGELGHEGRVVRTFWERFRKSPGKASPLRVASHSAIFCARVCGSKIPKMFYFFKKFCNPCVGIVT